MIPLKKNLKRIVICLVSIFLILGSYITINHALLRKTIYGDWNYLVKIGNYNLYPESSMKVLFFGSSHTYCSMDAKLLKEKYDVDAYVLATQRQSIKLNYYYIIEALKTQNPKTIVVELYMATRAEEYQDNDVLHDALDVLPMSYNKHQMIQNLVPEEDRLEFYFPIIKYHTRWKELSKEDFSYDYKKWIDVDRGYVRLNRVYPVECNLDYQFEEYKELSKQDLEYLEKIENLTKEKGIELIYMIAPYPMKQDDVNLTYTLENYANEKNIEFVNGYELMTELNYDANKDFCDEYGHLNESGAKKLTEYFAERFLD